MSGAYAWGQCEGLIPRGEQYNPCRYVKGREFSQVTDYEALALEIEDTFKVLSGLRQPVYELALLVATCGLRISESLGLRWRNVLWNRGLVAIRETFVHFNLQNGAKTKLSRSRVEAPQPLLDALAAWRRETMYADDNDFVFPSEKLHGEQATRGAAATAAESKYSRKPVTLPSRIVNTWAKSLANSSATDGSTGRNPVCAQTFCPSGVYRKFFSAVALSRWVPDVTTATGFSILNVCGGLMCSTGLPWRSTLIASFS